MVALNDQFNGFFGSKGVNAEELERTIANRINGLPGEHETSLAVIGRMISNDIFDRPDDYPETLAAKYRAFTAADLNKAIRSAVDPKGFVWVVVGDAAKIRPQLDKLGMPIEVVSAK